MWHIPPPPSATRLKIMYSDLLGPAPFRPSEGEGEAKFCITLYILWLMNVFINVLGNFSSYPDFFNQRFPQMFVYLLIRVLHLIFRACTNRTDGTFCDFVTDLWCSGIQSYIWIFHPNIPPVSTVGCRQSSVGTQERKAHFGREGLVALNRWSLFQWRLLHLNKFEQNDITM